MLRPDDVLVDPNVQRQYRPSHAKTIADGYSPARFGLGHVSLREDGRFYCVDGQHRCAAAKISGLGHVPVLFQVHHGLTEPQEAGRFNQLNENRKAVSAVDTFKMRLKAGDPAAAAIAAILTDYGLRAMAGKTRGFVGAVSALEAVYYGAPGRKSTAADHKKAQPELLRTVIAVLHGAWSDTSSAYDSSLVKGVALLIQKHGATINPSGLSKLLTKSGTPEQFVGQINALKQFSKIDALAAAVQLLEGTYFRHKRVRGVGEARG